MMRMCFYIFVYLLSSVYCSAQSPVIDSLVIVLKTAKEDSAKVNALNSLFLEYEFTDADKASEYLNKALALCQKSDYKKGLSTTYMYLGFLAEDRSNYPEALKNYHAALKIREEMRDKKGIADSYNNIGNAYYYQGNYPDALKSYFASLKLREAIGNKKGVADSYITIGNVYYRQENYPEALKNYFACLNIKEQIGDKKGIASSYNNIGIVYKEQGNYEAALKNQLASLEIMKTAGDHKNIADSHNNLGIIYYAQAELESNAEMRRRKLAEALENYFSSLKIEEAMDDKAGIASTCINIGNVFKTQKEYKEAEGYLVKAKELSKEIGYKEYLKDSYRALTELDTARGNYKGAYENHKLYILYRDSLDNEETRKKTVQNQMTFDFEKKEAVASAEHKKELENQELIVDEKSRKQKIVLLLVSCFLILVMIFAGFIFRSLRLTKKQKNIIELQKNVVEEQKQEVERQKVLVEEKQKEIIDSITYAKRIQLSLLPSERYIERSLNRLLVRSRN